MRTRVDTPSSWPQVLHVPKTIKKDIEERGFHLYKWISPEEVKLSIERDFLSAINSFWAPLWIFAVLAWLITGLNFFVFLGSILLWVIWIFIYLLFLSIRRSLMLSKSAFVVMTDSSISLGWKIHKLSDVSWLKKDIHEVSETFEEELFEESRLSWSKKKLSQEVMKQLFWGYEKIFSGTSRFGRMGWNSDDIRVLLALIWLYTLYAGIMACVYFIWVLWLLIFWKIITKINSWYLIKKWHTVLKINELFGQLDRDSDGIKDEKRSLSSLLSEASENNWQDGLLLKIEDGISSINTYASDAVGSVVDLKSTIESSKYTEMFSFEVYNTWIKKQIEKPLSEILDLLVTNKVILINTRNDLEKQIENTYKIDLQSVLKLSLRRVEMQLRDIDTFIPQLESSIKKLQS